MIFALATPVAQSALGVFRISGKGCCEVFSKALKVPISENRKVFLRDVFWFGVLVDRCSVVFYGAPASYTGEDSVEVFCHGGLSVIKSFTNMFLEMGFKEAGPGEFSKIAFENGKMSLNEVEAVADLIHADDLQKTVLSSEAVAGKLSEIILGLGKEVDEVRVFIEGSIDFSDEDYNFLVEGGVEKRLIDVRDLLVGLIDTSLISSRRVLKKRVLFFGPPNTGKSSLFNRLLGFERALVSSLPGTTRDLIDSEMFYNSVSLELVDSAGVRDTDDLIEAEGVALSGCEVGESDVVAVILDASTEVLASGFRELVKDSNYLMVFNKSDEGLPGGSYDCVVSARSGDGISGFKDLILESVKDGAVNSEKTYLIRERHLGLFKEALVLLDGCLKNISRESDIDIAAEDLRLVRSLFDEFLGVKYPDSLLGDIFKDFCIGK